MKKLILMRHAKSDWEAPYSRDFERPLNERGKLAAPRISAYAKENDLLPDLILCSSAMRTRQTCALFTQAAGMHDTPITYEDQIYGADIRDITSLIRSCAGDPSTLMVIGHNPTLGGMAYNLSPEHAHDFGKFPTCSFAAFEFDRAHWEDFDMDACTFFDFVKPSDLT